VVGGQEPTGQERRMIMLHAFALHRLIRAAHDLILSSIVSDYLLPAAISNIKNISYRRS
jgi:hypothetical protein